jgi:intraflagellar transport protein 88
MNPGFGQTNAMFNKQTQPSQYDFQNVKPPPTGYGGPSRAGMPPGTAMKAGQDKNRPVTSNRGANYGTAMAAGDPMGQTMRSKQVLETKKTEVGPDEQAKKIEKEIHALIEASAQLSVKANHAEALEKAKEAAAKEKQLKKARESSGTIDQLNPDLAFCVQFTLANQYQNNGMANEALQAYTSIVKDKKYAAGGRLRVNMGNIYFEQKKYSVAIKMYRMALDIIPKSSKEMRYKILKNIGHAFVKLGQFQDAFASYDAVLEGAPDFNTAFNLILCLYALGDSDKLKKYFSMMLSIDLPGSQEEEEEEEEGHNDEKLLKNDKLKEEMKERSREALKFILESSKLIAPMIDPDIINGYDWIIEALKSSSYQMAESEIEIAKALAFLKRKNIEKAIESLKSLEKKDKSMMARAATNISFLYFLESDFKNAEHYAEIAVEYDRYNAKALVNKGNCLYVRNEFLRAKEQYLEAIGVEADCVEALYNLAFVNKKLNMFMEALQALDKLQTIVSSSPEVIYQIASLHELMGDFKNALKWYQILLTKTPSDPNILARMGAICSREEDEHQALHYYSESYKYLPVNIDTISWLGIYYVKSELYEKACIYFERAAQIQTKEIKWKLMVASCYRRMGSYQKALKMYEDVYAECPDNLECLKFLVQLCKDMNLRYDHYASQLKKVERALEAQQARFGGFGGQDDDDDQPDYRNQHEPIESHVNIETRGNPKQKMMQQRPPEDDEWANQEQVDDMLPM